MVSLFRYFNTLPDVYEYLEAEGFFYAIRLPGNQVLQRRISRLLTPPVGRPPKYLWRYYFSFDYRAQSWNRDRRVVAKIEWHPGEMVPRLGFIVTNLVRPAEDVVAFYNQVGKAEQYIREGKHAINGTRPPARGCATTRSGFSPTRLRTISPTPARPPGRASCAHWRCHSRRHTDR